MQSVSGSLNKDLISIFIPTYNRSQIFSNTLNSVIQAVCDYHVHIYIYDNSQTSETSKVVQNARKNYSLIYYKKNHQNLGIDLNMVNVLNHNDSCYTLMLGDDDLLSADFIPKISRYIDRQTFDFVVLSTNLSEKTQIFTDKDKALFYLWNKMPFGTLIINNLHARALRLKKYIGTSHLYSAIAWELMNHPKAVQKCLYYSEDLLVYRPMIEKTWSNIALDIYLYQIPLWFSLLPSGYPCKDRLKEEYLHDILSIRSLFAMWKVYDFSTLSGLQFLSEAQKGRFLFFRCIQCRFFLEYRKRLRGGIRTWMEKLTTWRLF